LGIASTVITADGKTLISGSWDDTVKIWDMVEGRELRTLAGHEDSILCVALNPAEDIIASAGWDATIVVWDLKTGKRLNSMEGHRGSIVALSFSADGLRLASTSEDRTTRVWDIEKGRYSLTLPGYGADPTAISFVESTTSRLVAIGDAKGTVRIWDLGAIGQRDELTTLRGHTGSVTMFAFNPQRAMLVSASVDNTVRLWDLDKQRIVQLLPKLPDKVASVKFSLDGELFAFATYGPVVQVWNVATSSSRDFQAPRGDERIRYVAFSPDGALLAAGSDDGRITLWSVKDAKVIISFIAHSAKIQGLEFNPLGTLLASSSDDAKVKLWRTSDWVLMHEFSGHRTGTYGIAFSPDGQALVSTSDDKTVRLWAVKSGKELIKPITHDGLVWSADFSPDGKLIATGGEDSTVQLWNMSIDRTAAKLDHHQVLRISDGPVWWIKFANTSKGLIIGVGGQDRTIRLLNLTKLGQMFGKPDRLEYEAEQQSGLQASQKDNVIDLVPISPNRFAISGIGN
jgi:WD40 repeat protein